MSAPLFHVKICGITVAADARLAATAGADAVGLNFVAGSPRRLEIAAAREVAAAVPRGVLKVGVFAGAEAGDVRRTVEAVGLDAVQLHGHLFAGASGVVDPPELCAALAGIPVIRAVRLDAAGPDAFATARRWLAQAAAAGAAPAMALVDAAVPGGAAAGQLGGTGAVADWDRVRAAAALPVPLAVAGGLTADNVVAAISASGCRAVDTASGVESAPGVKEPARVRAFVAAARRALGLPGL
jgi:phosphoribosylanthranilate isomerase